MRYHLSDSSKRNSNEWIIQNYRKGIYKKSKTEIRFVTNDDNDCSDFYNIPQIHVWLHAEWHTLLGATGEDSVWKNSPGHMSIP